MSENPYKELREDFEFLKGGYRLTQQKLAEEFQDKTKDYYCATLKSTAIRKIETDKRHVSENEMNAYRLRFNTTADYLLGFTTVKYQKNEDVEMIEKVTGLTSNAINTLSLLKKKKYVNQNRFDCALHTLNMILDKYENANLFELIYHYLFGNYTTMGHYDEYGQCVYDGSQVFVSDRFLTNQLEINTKYVDAAVLHMITGQLDFWKNHIREKCPANYGKLLPEKDSLLKEIKEEESSKRDLHEKLQYIYSLMEVETQKTPVNTERMIELTENYHSMKTAIELIQRRIDEFAYTLKEIYHYDYERK